MQFAMLDMRPKGLGYDLRRKLREEVIFNYKTKITSQKPAHTLVTSPYTVLSP